MPTFGGNRTVWVSLEAKVTGYLAGFRSATTATKDFAQSAVKASQTHKKAWSDIGSGALKAGGLIGVGVGLAVKEFADFDKAMSRAAAGTQATGKELAELRAAAIKAGADTQFSATEAADAITALGKAGVSTNDILSGGLKGSLDLAAAGELKVGDAAEIAATALTQFQLKGKDLPHVADLLAAGAGKAQGEVSDLSNALKYVGPVAHGMGVSLEQTVGTLAEFASQGIISEQAGTGLRGVLSTLSSPSKAAAKELKALGINVYDASGNFVGLEGAAGQLHGALSGMTQAQRDAALGIIFGNEQLTAARVLYAGGADAVHKWTGAVNDQGFAAKQAARLTDNLSGDIERLGGSLSSAFISTGSAANDSLRAIVQTAEGAVNLFNGLPGPLQQTALGFAAAAAGSLLLVGGTAKAVTGVVTLKANLAELGVSSTRLRSGLGGIGSFLGGPWGLAMTAATVGLGLFVTQQVEASQRAKELRDSLDEQTGAVTNSTRALVAHRLQEAGVLDQARALGLSLSDVTDAALGNSDALHRLDTASGANVQSLGGLNRQARDSKTLLGQLNQGNVLVGKSFDFATDKADLAASSYIGLRAIVGESAGTVAQQAAAVREEAEARGESTGAAGKAVSAESSLAAITQQVTEQNQKAKAAQDAFTDSLNKSKNAFLQLRGGERGYEAALDSTTAALKSNGKTLDVHSEKGRNNAAALDDQAGAALDYLSTLDAESAPAATFNRTLDATHSALEKAARSFGLSAGAAKAYADKALAVPHKVETDVTQPGMPQAKQDTAKLTDLIHGVPQQSITGFAQPGLIPGITSAGIFGSTLRGIPSSVSSQVTVGGLFDAIAQTQQLAQDLRSLDGKVVETKIVTRSVDQTTGQVHIHTNIARAAGGPIPGDLGTPGRDSVHALLMPREYVQPVAAVDYYGLSFMDAIRTRSLPKFADGGYVARVTATAPGAVTRPVVQRVTNIYASSTSAQQLAREQAYQERRLDAVRGRG